MVIGNPTVICINRPVPEMLIRFYTEGKKGFINAVASVFQHEQVAAVTDLKGAFKLVA